MAETSVLWDGTVTGDAATYPSPYCKGPWARKMRGISALADRTVMGVVWTREAAYNGMLACSNPAGIQIQVATGRANVNGWIYENDAAITLNPGAGNGYYRVVLQRDFVAQTIVAALIFNAGAFPAPTQNDAAVWEISLARFQIAAGAITAAGVVDEREYAGPPWVKLDEQILTAAGVGVLFSSIPTSLRHLEIRGRAHQDAGGSSALRIFFNGDGGNNYDYVQHYNRGDNTRATSSGVASAGGRIGFVSAATGNNDSTAFVIHIPDYARTTFRKSAIGFSQSYDGAAAATLYQYRHDTWWRNTAAITQIQLSTAGGNLTAGSLFTLYGILY